MKKVKEQFGSLVFGTCEFKNRLSSDSFSKYQEAIADGYKLSEAVMEEIAEAIKCWAIEKGATHYAHWFQPLRSVTAEKQEALAGFDESGTFIEYFTAKDLRQTEPDASSFPCGDLRITYAARGYTAWDVRAFPFLAVRGNTKTLMLPAVFISWIGDVLDHRLPLIRSIEAVNDQMAKIKKHLGKDAGKVNINIGIEQEYFLLEEKKYHQRTDLKMCGRTLFGAPAIKGQQLDDYYFAPLPDRVMDFFDELDLQLHTMGIPAKSRHYEVCPNQFELVSLFQECMAAVDHNLMTMDIIQRVARKHGFIALLHEKPFYGLNGSGKHVNWSIGDRTCRNYLDVENGDKTLFLVIISAMLIGFHDCGEILSASIADSANDHRRGEKEAPPYAVSVYLGEKLSKALVGYIEDGEFVLGNEHELMQLIPSYLPTICKDVSDRNRTTPIGFTGDKLEFRAPGASQNPSEFIMNINLLLAYGLDKIIARLETTPYKEDQDSKAMNSILREMLSASFAVCYNGDNYSKEWDQLRDERGIRCYYNAVDAYKVYTLPHFIRLYEKFNILYSFEINMRVECKVIYYCIIKRTEFKTAVNIIRTQVLPEIFRQITGAKIEKCDFAAEYQKKIGNTINKLIELTDILEKCVTVNPANDFDTAYILTKSGDSTLREMRNCVDFLEGYMEQQTWPLPSYDQLLQFN